MTRALVRLAAVLLLTCSAAAAAEITPALRRALASADKDARVPVWVHFLNKGPAPATEADLRAAATHVSDRALARRAKIRRAGAPQVDGRDLPLHRPYLDAVTAQGATPRTRSRWFNAASFDVPADLVTVLADRPEIRRLDLVRSFRRDPLELVPAAPSPAKTAVGPDLGELADELAQLRVPEVHAEGWSGAGVLVGMMDTGFRTTHEAFAALTVVDAYDFLNDDPVVDNEPDDPVSAHNHGTATWSNVGARRPGVLVGPAYAADFALAKTEDVAGEYPQEEDFWVAGLEWLEGLGVDVVNSSLGYYDWYEFADLDGNTAVTTRAADQAAALGVTVVCSAGNARAGAWGHIIAPADGDSVIAVGAVDADGAVTYFSSPGPTADGRIKPDVAARGLQNSVAGSTADDAYGAASGTSLSGPLVAGVAALILERQPSLTPVQVREALRATADHALQPDNDVGWGVVDAHAAVHYWGPTLLHEPLTDTEDTASPLPVSARLLGRDATAAGTAAVRWRVDGGAWQTAPLTLATGNLHEGEIPAQPGGGLVEYYLEAVDVLGLSGFAPGRGAADPIAVLVGPDLAPPTLTHVPLPDLPVGAWPPLVRATAADNLGLAGVTVGWSLDGVPQADFPLAAQGDDLYLGYFPDPVPAPAPGAVLSYTITAVDAAAAANTAVDGPHALTLVDAPGRVLLVDADGSVPTAAAIPPSADLMEAWLTGVGYLLARKAPAEVTAADLDGVQLVALACGGNISPASVLPLRPLLTAWTASGGRLFAEGGQLAATVLIDAGDADFARDVLHVDAWQMDLGGNWVRDPAHAGHPVLTTPHLLPAAVQVSPASYADQDVVSPAGDAQRLWASAAYAPGAGLVAHDAGDAAGGRTLTLTCNLAALPDTSQSRRLVQNAAAWLTQAAPPVTAAPAGPPAVTALADVAPNPFNPRTRVAFTLAAAAAPRLTVVDLRGRMVRELLDGRELAPGRHTADWDGRDARGRAAPAGVYLVRLSAAGLVDHRKITLAR